MNRWIPRLIVYGVFLSGCSHMPEQTDAVNRGPGPEAYLIRSTVTENGVRCHYNNGTTRVILNRAAPCP